MLLDARLERLLGLETDELFDHLSLAQDEQGWNAHNPEMLGRHRASLSVELADNSLVAHLTRKLIDDRSLHLARPTPAGKKID